MEQIEPTTLLQSLTEVSEAFSHLGQRLVQAANVLQTTGVPPEEGLLNEMLTAKKNFVALCVQGCALAESLAIEPLPRPEMLTSVTALKTLLQGIALTEEKRKAAKSLSRRAIAVLNRVCTLRHRDLVTFAPLDECHAKAISLRNEIAETPWPKTHPSAEAIVNEDDTFSALLTLVQRGDELDDELCSAFQDVVSQAFGKPLAIAAIRGKLVFPAELKAGAEENQAQEASLLSSVEPQVFVESQTATETGEALRTEPAPPAPSLVSLTESLADVATANLEAPSFLLDNIEGGEPESTGPRNPLYRFAPEERSQRIAALLLNGANGIASEKPAILRDLVWRLVCEERVSLAFHVARCLETHYPEVQPQLPSWVLRAVVLSQRVRTPNGEIARTLKEDFARYQPDCQATGNYEWDLATELLLAAASLSPTLLAPETGAATVLHSLYFSKELPYLTAFCEQLVRYSDHLVPLDPSLFKKLGRPQLRETMGFVRRMYGKKEAGQEQIAVLRQEVVNFYDPIREELKQLRDANPSVLLAGGTSCCQRALDQVRALCDAEIPFLLDEPLPRPLLNADVSRIPSLVMNKQGEIEGVDQLGFAESVLRLVASGALKMI